MDNGPIRIDVDEVIRERLPRYYPLLKGWPARKLARMICQDEMNEMLRVNHGRRGADFCRGVLSHLGITYDVHGAENLDPAGDPRPVIVSNHPLGGLDGMMLIDHVARVYGPGVHFVVNDLLEAIEPLSDVFLPVNKHGRQSREAAEAVDEAFEGNAPIIMFPAGLVSRRGKDGAVRDLQWQRFVVNRCVKHRRNIIPTFFSGENSSFFYNFARLRTRLGLKFNVEMIRLPKEVFLCRGRHFDIYHGEPIAWDSLQGGRRAQSEADMLRRAVYALRGE